MDIKAVKRGAAPRGRSADVLQELERLGVLLWRERVKEERSWELKEDTESLLDSLSSLRSQLAAARSRLKG
jgi:hypothetical protein